MGKIKNSTICNPIAQSIKTAYANLPLKKALAITSACSIFLAVLSAVLIAAATRPSYYRLVSSNPERGAILLHDICTVSSMGICVGIVIAAGIYMFYKYKLYAPLEILSKGVEQIAMDNLDFSIQYEAQDEFGALCRSFDRMRDELRQNNGKMWRMTEERKKLNASFAHDLRTPLTVLRGYTDFLEEYIPSPGRKDEKLLATTGMMTQYIERLENYVEIMNTIQKLEDTPIRIQQMTMDHFSEMLEDNIKTAAGKYGKEYSIRNETALNEIHADVRLIFRVLENITANAFRYAKSKVQIRLFKRRGLLYFEVVDDGPGFGAQDLEQALNPFYTSGHNASSHFGLGLSICKTLCENHGGGISIGNSKYSGAKVEVSFLLVK